MGTTINLPCVRFVKRVTNGALFSKYSYLSMMAQNAAALEQFLTEVYEAGKADAASAHDRDLTRKAG